MNTLERITDLSLKGLTVDGAHHKQWFLEQILTTIGYDVEVLREKQELGEKGIAP